MDIKNKDNRFAFILAFNSLLWAGNFIAVKIAGTTIGSRNILFFRFLFAIIFLIPLTFKDLRKLNIKKLFTIKYSLVSIIYFFHFATFTIGLQMTSSINASIIIAMNPIIATLLATLFLDEKINKYNFLAIFVSILGAFIMITRLDINIIRSMKVNMGDLVILVATILNALYFVFSKKYSSSDSPKINTFVTITVCFICSLFFAQWDKLFISGIYNVTNLSAMAYSGFISTAVCVLIYQTGIKKLGVSISSIFMNLIPVFNIVLSITILKESLYMTQIIGCIFVIISLFININAKKMNKNILGTIENFK